MAQKRTCLSDSEVADDAISGGNVKNIEDYVVVSFEVAIFSSFEIFHKDNFVTVKSATVSVA